MIVEMWVNQEDLYRPTPDPETSDHKAELAVQLNETINVWGLDCKKWAFPNPYLFFSTDQTYQSWFAYNAATTYYNPSTPKNTAPWTRLGYTYDWAPPAPASGPGGQAGGAPTNHVGASEFMIKTHSNLDGRGTTGVYATYIRAIKDYDKSWDEYFRCQWRRDGINSDKVPHADIKEAAAGD